MESKGFTAPNVTDIQDEQMNEEHQMMQSLNKKNALIFNQTDYGVRRRGRTVKHLVITHAGIFAFPFAMVFTKKNFVQKLQTGVFVLELPKMD